MREINVELIENAVCRLLISSNYILPDSLFDEIVLSKKKETSPLARDILEKLEENARYAAEAGLPICQDTGMAVVFLEIGQQVQLVGGNLEDAINSGVRKAYDSGYLRKSVVKDPLYNRSNTNDNTPAVIHTRIVDGDRVKIVVAPKGFGSENMSKIKMFNPSATEKDIIDFVVETVNTAGGNPCPPLVIGVGLGGTFEMCAYLSKKALARDIAVRNENPDYSLLEKKILDAVNKTDVGPQGFGGNTTALAVNVEYFPTHIAGLPCAVNIGCHVTRHAETEI